MRNANKVPCKTCTFQAQCKRDTRLDNGEEKFDIFARHRRLLLLISFFCVLEPKHTSELKGEVLFRRIKWKVWKHVDDLIQRRFMAFPTIFFMVSNNVSALQNEVTTDRRANKILSCDLWLQREKSFSNPMLTQWYFLRLDAAAAVAVQRKLHSHTFRSIHGTNERYAKHFKTEKNRRKSLQQQTLHKKAVEVIIDNLLVQMIQRIGKKGMRTLRTGTQAQSFSFPSPIIPEKKTFLGFLPLLSSLKHILCNFMWWKKYSSRHSKDWIFNFDVGRTNCRAQLTKYFLNVLTVSERLDVIQMIAGRKLVQCLDIQSKEIPIACNLYSYQRRHSVA